MTGTPGSSSSQTDDAMARTAGALLAHGHVDRWSSAGALTEDDLTIRVSSEVTNAEGEVIGQAGFNLSTVRGFRDSPKCNLLVFELAFRAGFVVPLMGRRVGWGFPASDRIAQDASDGSIVGRWARVVRRPDAREINLDREIGNAFVAVGSSAIGSIPGHIAVIDWVDDIDLTPRGEIRRLSFMGWEANSREGARYSRMNFATTSAVPRARFLTVYVLELRAAEPGHEIAIIGSWPRRPTELFADEGRDDDS